MTSDTSGQAFVVSPPAPATGSPIISLRNLEKTVNEGAGTTWLLRRISLDIRDGEFVTVVGPSGAGKSTLLGILGMLDHQWSGEFDFDGQPVHALKARDRVALNKQSIGIVFQQYHLIDDLTVAENLDMPLSYRNVKKSETRRLNELKPSSRPRTSRSPSSKRRTTTRPKASCSARTPTAARRWTKAPPWSSR